MKVIILAGGKGLRLWPFSREEFPKQFLHFGDEVSFLQKTIQRMCRFPLVEEIVLSTSPAYAELVSLQVEALNPSLPCSVLVEPEKRDTAPAIAFALKCLEEEHLLSSSEPLLVLPSDQFISPEELFYKYLEKGVLAAQAGKIVLFGIRPHKPETGYGYVQIGPPLQEDLYQVKRFCEKPDSKRAEEYLLRSDYFWNAGILSFTAELFWQEAAKWAPELCALHHCRFAEARQTFSHLPRLSIDYALLEKSQNIAICPMELSWSDVGSWDHVYEILEKDAQRNVKRGNIFDLETEDSLLLGGKKPIFAIGLKDLLIVETDEGIFISTKGKSERVKELVKKLVRS